MVRSMKLAAARYMQENAKLFVYTIILFIVGVLFGAIVVNALANGQKADLFTYLRGFFGLVNDNHLPDSAYVTWHSIATNLKMLGLIWILGLSIIGLPLIVVLIFLKGFTIGFTVGFLVENFASKGLMFAVLAVLPQNLIIVPSLIIAGVAGTAFSLMLVRSRFTQNIPLYQKFLSYTGLVLVLAVFMIVASFVEGYVSPLLMKMITPHL
ncbi:stage II sporulation protein M [Effusibacillus lacus]|uniref:Stage II sporulation protein M n=1 Tax=Effusibacillus lacus TaxID=1348429 RepID=A0A292YEQ3_9BACL|nr:stage II sporulation protein M [Effusibacillus lacus]TCS76328.1 stage II sporulation protein M [Effusibacillus lacus]GAX91872.1 stage II sporulation protein M [Effusibacillus lacus]